MSSSIHGRVLSVLWHESPCLRRSHQRMSVHHLAQLVIELSIKCGAIIPGQTGVVFLSVQCASRAAFRKFPYGGLLRFLLAEK